MLYVVKVTHQAIDFVRISNSLNWILSLKDVALSTVYNLIITKVKSLQFADFEKLIENEFNPEIEIVA